jgi:site-specific DNA-methyltransferase (adenine-specific)
VLRDLTERVVIASKGRFDRARSVEQRQQEQLPHRNTLTNDEFMEATLDVWRIPPESARRVRHPAPFPVELPLRLIELYTYAGDLVLDPFLGSGTTAVAALRCGRRYAGYDTDPAYVEIARARVAAERGHGDATTNGAVVHAGEGKAAQAIAETLLTEAGFTLVDRNHKMAGLGLAVSLVARDRNGTPWYFDVSGSFTTVPAGLLRADTLWRCLGRTSVLAAKGVTPVVLLTSQLPARRSAGDVALRTVGPQGFFDAMEMLAGETAARLAHYAGGDQHQMALPGFWTPAELAAAPPLSARPRDP